MRREKERGNGEKKGVRGDIEKGGKERGEGEDEGRKEGGIG